MSVIFLARTRGMCAGVARAIAVVERALDKFGAKRVYVLHEVVHNRHVVEDLRGRGAKFVESLSEIPEGSVVIFSAHGVGLETVKEANARGFTVIDATCPLVARIHRKMNAAGEAGKAAVVIGHAGHQEVTGTIGQYTGSPSLVHVVLTPQDVEQLSINEKNIIFATQTTLSVDETAATVAALKVKFPQIEGPRRDDTCYATQLRQRAIKELSALCDVILVAGSPNSSNSNRLREVAESGGKKAYLIDDASYIDLKWLEGAEKIGLSAGASAPEYVVDGIIAFLKEHGVTELKLVGEENRHAVFPLPKGLE